MGRRRHRPQLTHFLHPPVPASQPSSSRRAAFPYLQLRCDQKSPVSSRCLRIGSIWSTYAIRRRYYRTTIRFRRRRAWRPRLVLVITTITITIITCDGRRCSHQRLLSWSVRRVFSQVEHAGGERVEFESDVEPRAIGHQLRYQYVFYELGLYSCH